MRTTRVSQAIVRTLVVLAIACAGNMVADFVFGAYATLSDVAWGDYRASGELDCVFVGSSYAQRSFDPVAYDERLGTSSVNLATPGQVLTDTYDTVRTVIEERQVRRVVLGIGIQSFGLSCDPYATVPFLRARFRDDPLPYASALLRLAIDPQVITTKSSLNVLFPWTFTSVRSISGVAQNVRSRLVGEAFGTAAEKTVPLWHYVGKGYGNYENDPNVRELGDTLSVYGEPELLQECLGQLTDLCDLCRENDVDLVVVVTPHPSFDLVSMGSLYPEDMSLVKTLVENGGATFLDFSLVRDGVLNLTEEDFKDFEHLNLDGARAFSVALADMMGRRDAGEDIEGLFYSYDQWDEWVSAHAQS